VLKLDFAKAFDTVNWEGLFKILHARSFEDVWINWVQTILSSSKSVVLVNGCPGPWITCKRGLRQGDPLSPYLFLLVAETLQKMIQAKAAVITHPLDSGAPCVVLQYANDTLLVLRGDPQGVSRLKSVLDQFAAATGLSINYTKRTAVPHPYAGISHQPMCRRPWLQKRRLSANLLRVAALSNQTTSVSIHSIHCQNRSILSNLASLAIEHHRPGGTSQFRSR
jgi:hypothetical protein